MAQIAYETPEFRRDYRRSSRQDQDKIDRFIRKFSELAESTGTDLKTPQSAADGRVKTARVDRSLRAVLVHVGRAAYALVRVLPHDDAYKAAGSLRPDVSSFNGLPRLIQLDQLAAEGADPAAPTIRAERAAPALLAHRSTQDFEVTGVPPFIAMAVSRLPDAAAATAFADELGTNDPLLGFAIHLLLDENLAVDEVVDELLALEGGTDDRRPSTGAWSGLEPEVAETPVFDTDDLAGALARPGAAERFREVNDSEELVQALKGDFADWQVFLHPLQRQAAYASYSGPARVSGGAGTGKTVVLVHRAKALLERAVDDDEGDRRILLTTFTAHLQEDLKRLLAQLVGEERAQEVEIETVDRLARRLHHEMTGTEVGLVTPADELELWSRIASERRADRSPAFLRNEYRHVLLARSVRTQDDYMTVSRAGRGVRISRTERLSVWPAFEAFDARTRGTGNLTTLQLTESVAALMGRLPSPIYDHVLVDEAQDLHASQWRLLRAITHVGDDDLFIASDALQRIYGDTVSLRSLGIETRGRSVRLRRNYRTTHEIVAWALGIAGGETVVDIDDLGANLAGYHSVRHGPVPRFGTYADETEELDGLVTTVRAWLEDGHRPSDVVVVMRSTKDVPPTVTHLQHAGITAAQLGRRGRVSDAVNVSTMHRIKGLEYPCVAIVGLSVDRVPPSGSVCSAAEDRSQHLTDVQTERSLIYVAATRARDELAISWAGEPTALLERDPTSLPNHLLSQESP